MSRRIPQDDQPRRTARPDAHARTRGRHPRGFAAPCLWVPGFPLPKGIAAPAAPAKPNDTEAAMLLACGLG